MTLAATACHDGHALVVLKATYGASCGQKAGNASWVVSERCAGTTPCTFAITPAELGGDPAEGCEKDFEVVWACRDGQPGPRRFYEPARTSFQKVVVLACE